MRDIIITTYLTGINDPQRGKKWDSENMVKDTFLLRKSCSKRAIDIVILSDNPPYPPFIDDFTEINETNCTINPYFQRWISIGCYLKDNDDIRYVFCLDANDTEVLKNPFPNIKDGNIYVGTEQTKLNNKWIREHHRSSFIPEMIRKNWKKPFLNAGIIGGDRDTVIRFCDLMNYYFRTYGDDYTDIPAINDAIRGNWPEYRIITGDMVNTVFKSYEKDNKTAWFRHK